VDTHLPVDPPSAPVTILLVEDEETVRRVTARMLEKLGYAVLTAPSAEDALQVHAREGHRVNLVLTDVVMPGLTGIELAEQLREQDPSIRILFTSGYTSRELGRSPDDPPTPFLPKPFSVEDLARMVRTTLQS
jgi:two-component system, cell cycle sensor histidine kinase and response regulator CckA